MYDDKYIYFLFEYADAEKSVYVATWFFDTVAKRWVF